MLTLDGSKKTNKPYFNGYFCILFSVRFWTNGSINLKPIYTTIIFILKLQHIVHFILTVYQESIISHWSSVRLIGEMQKLFSSMSRDPVTQKHSLYKVWLWTNMAQRKYWKKYREISLILQINTTERELNVTMGVETPGLSLATKRRASGGGRMLTRLWFQVQVGGGVKRSEGGEGTTAASDIRSGVTTLT